MFNMDKKEWLEDMRGNLSMIAALIAAITFQAALNPPGGLVQTITDNERTTYGCSYAYDVYEKTQEYLICPREAVLAIVYSHNYLTFLWCNTISFVASVSAALLLVTGIPLRHRLLMWFLSIAMSASLTFLAITYIEAVLMVTPDPIWDEARKIVRRSMQTWIGLLLLIILFNAIRFLFWLVKKCRKLFNLQKNKRNTSANEEINVA
ncbi:hypothetical protein L6164_031600 [Bauhinia variegata]|uniref:Uncharacterized protein n=1 Tax=Bauhinia variegata TaxID=167791 RepID=A0ACB9LH34_BAUVA|nr:hypothetical protein L6164_031600 [Bauhinia variegata]